MQIIPNKETFVALGLVFTSKPVTPPCDQVLCVALIIIVSLYDGIVAVSLRAARMAAGDEQGEQVRLADRSGTRAADACLTTSHFVCKGSLWRVGSFGALWTSSRGRRRWDRSSNFE